MPAVEKLLLAFSIGRGAVGRWRLQHILATLVTVILLTVVVVILSSILMIGGFYATYHFLLSLGLDGGMAFLIIAALILTITCAAIAALQRHVRKLSASVRTPVNETVDAFLDGLFSKR